MYKQTVKSHTKSILVESSESTMKTKGGLLFTFVLLLTFFLPSEVSHAVIKERHEYERTGNVFWEAQTDEMLVALTFDDGPHPANTPELLDLLKKHNVHATFFVVGKWVDAYPELAHRIVDEGHEIANHTYSHNYDEQISKDTLMDEIEKTNVLLESELGFRPTFFRPVGGYYTDEIIEAAIDLNQDVLLWSWHQDPRDWAGPRMESIAAHILNGITPGDVILLHDGGGDREETLKAVDRIIPILKHRGYSFATASQLLHSNTPSPASS